MKRASVSLRTKASNPGKLRDMFSAWRKDTEVVARKTSVAAAEEIAEEAKSVIDTQAYSWVPLTARYLAQKIEEGLDQRTLIATGFYRDNICAYTIRGKVYVGVEPGVIHEPSGLPLSVLARVHEYGTSTIPPRPLWRPLLSSFLRRSSEFNRIYKRAKNKKK